MIQLRVTAAAFAAALLFIPAAVGPAAAGIAAPVAAPREIPTIGLTITGKAGTHRFRVELARTHEEQNRGLMYRTNIPQDGGMLFAPYPAEGAGRGKEARFWMHNTPTALDLIFIRADGSIDKIVANAVPFSDDRIYSEGVVTAVLEVNAGVCAKLGIVAGDTVSWEGQKR